MADKLPDNARYIAVVQPNEEDLKTLLAEIRRQLRDYPDRPVVAIIYREVPAG